VAEAPFVATHGDRTATVTRWMESIDVPPFGPARFGMRWTARARWTAGRSSTLRRHALSEREKAENHRICVCVSRVVGRITLDCAYRPDA
jgi:hypothetical protein